MKTTIKSLQRRLWIVEEDRGDEWVPLAYNHLTRKEARRDAKGSKLLRVVSYVRGVKRGAKK